MSDWRISVGVTVYITSQTKEIDGVRYGSVYLSPPESKYQLAVKRMIDKNCSFSEVTLEENEFSLKFLNGESSFIPVVHSDYLPGDDVWYIVENFPEYYTRMIILEVKDIQDKSFEAAFCDNTGLTILINPEMKIYKSCVEEFKRKMNYELHKKTKTLIPGHRYLTETDTIYYLGKVSSRLKKDSPSFNMSMTSSSSFAKNISDTQDIYLFTKTIYESDKKVSDVLETRCFMYGLDKIDFFTTYKSVVDDGEVLENNFDEHGISHYWKFMLENLKNKINEDDLNTNNILSPLLLISDSSDIVGNTSDDKEYIVDLVSSLIKKIIVTEVVKKPILKNDKDKNDKFYLNFIPSGCTIDILNYIGLDNEKINLLAINTVNEFDPTCDFDTYIKYIQYFKSKNGILYLDQTATKIKNINTLIYIDDVKNIICELFKYAKDTEGLGVSYYKSTNLGTKSSPKFVIDMIIMVNDIVNFCKDRLTKDLMKSIIDLQFTGIEIIVNKDNDIV